MSLRESECWYSNNCLHFLNCIVPLYLDHLSIGKVFGVNISNSNTGNPTWNLWQQWRLYLPWLPWTLQHKAISILWGHRQLREDGILIVTASWPCFG